MSNVEKFIATVRDSFIGSQRIYTKGSCYHFYLILKEVYSTAECWYDGNHVLTKIDNKFYDITGEVSNEGGEDMKLHKFEGNPTYFLKAPYDIYKLRKQY